MKISAIEAFPVRLPREREKAVRTAGSPTALVGSGDYRWSAVFPTLDAISGVDIALWDLAGKIQQKPVYELIPESAKRSEVPAYYSGIPGATAVDRVENALRQREQGFQNFK